MADETPKPFVAADDLQKAIHQGDAEAALAFLLPLSAAQRHAHREALNALGLRMSYTHWVRSEHAKAWGGEAGLSQYRALQTALIACGQPADLLAAASHTVAVAAPDLAALCERFGLDAAAWRDGLQRGAEELLRQHPRHIAEVQRLIAAGLIERPQGTDYVVGLIAIPNVLWHGEQLATMLAGDPGLPQALLQVFELEGTSEFNLAALDKYAKSPDWEWKNIFLKALDDGLYTRALLLEKTLGTLESDWPQFRAGWFSRFHDALAPTVDEMAPLAPRYLGLCQSRIPPTVTLALGALKSLHAAQRVEGTVLLDALQPVFYSSIKGQVEAALKLAEAVVEREPALAHAAAAAATPGLLHEAPALQKKLIERLRAWGLDEATRAALAEQLDKVASVNRPMLAALAGEPGGQGAAAPAAPPTPAPTGAGPADPLDPGRALPPIDSEADLVERIAFVLENPAEIDALERVLEALVRLAPLSDDLRARCAPLLKRARKLLEHSMAGQLARLLIFVLSGERAAMPAIWEQVRSGTGDALFAQRVDDLIAQATQGWGLPPLSAATHANGFIDPARLAQRLESYRARGATPIAAELERARWRSAPRAADLPVPAAWSIRTAHSEYQDKTYTHHYFEVAHIDDSRATRDWGEASLRYRAASRPGDLEDFFAHGCLAVGNNLDWWSAEWHNRAFLDLLLLPTTAITGRQPMAVLLLALALAGKEPGQTTLAVDALVQGVLDGRLDTQTLAAQLRALLATPIVMATRYAKSLQAAARADARLAPVVFDLVCTMVTAEVQVPPKGLAALLELLLELALSQQRALPAPTRQALAQLSLGGKGRTVQRQLLALD